MSLFLALGLLLPAAVTHAIQCYECHGTKAPADFRPVDAGYRNISTGGFQGNHRTHMASTATPSTCENCHPGSGSYTTTHWDGKIKIAGHLNGSIPVTKYNNITSAFARTAAPALSSCTNVNCHFETTTPTWGATPLTSPANCNVCHGAAPADGSHPSGSGSGKKHGDYYTTTTTSCVKCHSDHTAEATPFAHATSAGNRPLVISFAAAPNSGFGRYTGNVNYPNYLPSQNPPRDGTCKNLYCHSPGNKAANFDAPVSTAAWGGSLTCRGCHKADVASGSDITTGSHQKHVNGLGVGFTQFKCVKCHAATVNSSMAIVNTANHVDKQVTLAFNNSSSAANGSYNGQLAKPGSPSVKAPGSAVGQCANVYCHSSGQGDGGTWPPTYQTPTWGTASDGQCGSCHGIQTKHDATGFAYGTATPLTTGSHTKHLGYFFGTGNVSAERKCAACHAYSLTGYAPNSCNFGAVCHFDNLVATKHANYEVNVGIPDYYGATASYNGSTRPGDGYGACSNTYCHSDGKATPTTYATPTWGNAASGACGSCHGVTAAAPPASTGHTKHVAAANPYRFKCANCHSGNVQSTANATVTPTFTNLTTHVDKVRNVKFDSLNPGAIYTSATQTCSTAYCHSLGNSAVLPGALPGAYGGSIYASITWSGNVTCTSCHGRSTINGMPDYTNGGVGTASANSHAKHVTTNSITCNECHEKTTKNNTSIRSTTPSFHVDGTRSVYFNLSGANMNGSFNNATATCSNVACHSNGRGGFTNVQWGVISNCGLCHPIAGLSATHAKHVDTTLLPTFYTMTANRSTGSTYNFGCSNCHPLTNVNHSRGGVVLDLRPGVAGVGTMRSLNRASLVTASGVAGTANSGTVGTPGTSVRCQNVYCHSNGYRNYTAARVYALTPDWYGGSFTGDRCANCHGNAPNSTIAGSKSHYNNKFLGYTSSPGGHQIGIHAMGIYSSPSGLAIAGTGGRNSHGNAATATTISCNVCHYATVTSARNDNNMVCVTCHYAGNTVGALAGNPAAIANKSMHVNGSVDVVFKNMTIHSKAQMRQKYFITHAYSSAWKRNVGYKVSGAYDSAKTPLNTATMWDSNTKTCSNIACHNGNSVKWTDNNGVTECISCHGSL